MILYYNKNRTLKTIIPHGEPVRQNDPLNIYVLFDKEAIQGDINDYVVGIRFRRPKDKDYYGIEHITAKIDKEYIFEKLVDYDGTIDESEYIGELKYGNEYICCEFNFAVSLSEDSPTFYPGDLKVVVTLHKIGTLENLTTGVAMIYVEEVLGLAPTMSLGMTQSQFNYLLDTFVNVNLEKLGITHITNIEITEITNNCVGHNNSGGNNNE